ncbi:hypothetical protein BB560_002966 [Smittium megazygosporum]|uniref:EF-hand domain-containing protein n=1 Tax=Smittium megazygosporum TaxID=133381 RepID=A0A2T9ZDF9_9FUNG|nr:hypothetical protein BB560_002966 [Smittium megazygosporum]
MSESHTPSQLEMELLSDAVLQEIFSEFDKHNSGKVPSMRQIQSQIPQDQTILSLFDLFSNKSSNSISKQDLEDTVTDLGLEISPQELQEMINVADLNGDGKVSLSEFKTLVSSKLNFS